MRLKEGKSETIRTNSILNKAETYSFKTETSTSIQVQGSKCLILDWSILHMINAVTLRALVV